MISIAYLRGKCKQSGDFFDKCRLLDRFFRLCYANRKRGDDFVIRPNTPEQKRILILLSIVIGLLLIGIGCFGVLLHQKSAQEPQHSTAVSAVSTDSTTTELEMKTQATTVSTSVTTTTTATTVSTAMKTTTIPVCAELATILENNGYPLSDLGIANS